MAVRKKIVVHVGPGTILHLLFVRPDSIAVAFVAPPRLAAFVIRVIRAVVVVPVVSLVACFL